MCSDTNLKSPWLREKILAVLSQWFIIMERLFYNKIPKQNFSSLTRSPWSPFSTPFSFNCSISLCKLPFILLLSRASKCLFRNQISWVQAEVQDLFDSPFFYYFFNNQPILYSLVAVCMNKNQRHGAGTGGHLVGEAML